MRPPVHQPNRPTIYGPNTSGPPAYAAPGGAVRPSGTGAVSLACTNCGSDNTQALSVVYEAGLSHSTGYTAGAVVGGGGSGVASATTYGRSQTVQSRKAAPPAERRVSGVYFVLVGGAMVAFLTSHMLSSLVGLLIGGPGAAMDFLRGDGIDLNLAVSVLCAGAAVHMVRAVRAYNRTVHAAQLAEWRRTYVCQRCGTSFVPAELLPARPALSV